jgi:chromosome segregation ATPase
MRNYRWLLAVVLMAACSSQDAETVQDESAAEISDARDAASAEIKKRLDAAESNIDKARESVEEIDEDVAAGYHKQLDRIEVAHDDASAQWAKIETTTDDDWKAVTEEAKKASDEVGEAAHQAVRLTSDSKDEFLDGADKAMKDVEHSFTKLEAGAEDLGDDARGEFDDVAASLKKDYETVAESLDEVKDAVGDDWKDARHDFNHAFHKLTGDVEKAFDDL